MLSKGKSVARHSVLKQSLLPPPSSSDIERWQEGDTFSTMMQEYREGSSVLKKKQDYTMPFFYYDDEPDVSDEEKAMDSNENMQP